MTGVSAYSQRASARETEQLVMRHAELVKRIAYHLAGRLPASVEVDDLIQAGMLGLLEAARELFGGAWRKFRDLRRAFESAARCSTGCASSTGRRARCIARRVRWRTPSASWKLNTVARRAIPMLPNKMGVSLDEYHKIVEDAAGCQIASLTTEEGEINATDPEADPFRDVFDERFRSALSEAIDGLPERERMVMSLYYDDELNLKEIGAVLKVSESRICQIHGQALTRLQARLAGWRDRL